MANNNSQRDRGTANIGAKHTQKAPQTLGEISPVFTNKAIKTAVK